MKLYFYEYFDEEDLFLLPLCGGTDCNDSNPFINPAANEINPGRTRASRISHVIAGSAVRWPSSESALPFIRGRG